MLQRRKALSRYPPQQTIRWLGSLARQMKQQGQTGFYLERMQPTWLEKARPRRRYYGLTTGPISGLLVGLQIVGTILPFLLAALMTGRKVGAFFGWFSQP